MIEKEERGGDIYLISCVRILIYALICNFYEVRMYKFECTNLRNTKKTFKTLFFYDNHVHLFLTPIICLYAYHIIYIMICIRVYTSRI